MTYTSAREIPPQNWHASHKESLTRGERATDRMRNSMGSWGFVGGFLVFMVLWAILLIAAKRQDGIAAALAAHDFETNVAAKIDIETLLEINQRQIAMIEDFTKSSADSCQQPPP